MAPRSLPTYLVVYDTVESYDLLEEGGINVRVGVPQYSHHV